MGGNTAQSNTTNGASSARGMGTPHSTAHASINPCSATEQDIKNSCAASPIRGAEQGEYAVFPTTIRGWPIPTVHQTSGPSDDGKDVNKGVMS
jgi:hypothetical protein